LKIPKNKLFRYGGIILIVIGIAVLIWPFYTNFFMKRQEARILDAWEKQVMATTVSEKPSADIIQNDEATVETIAPPGSNSDASSTAIDSETEASGTVAEELFLLNPEKKVPFKILIPKIGVEWIVHEGTDIPSLKRGPGHYPGTALPGENGLCIIAGHRTTYGAPFNRVDQLEKGDEIILQTAKNEDFVYHVAGKTETLPDDVSVLNQTTYPSLALTTCTPKFYATRRLIVFADMI
jgi:LPXTG-site transpeptidase (sortase) family protein